jgi:hypothetical protein
VDSASDPPEPTPSLTSLATPSTPPLPTTATTPTPSTTGILPTPTPTLSLAGEIPLLPVVHSERPAVPIIGGTLLVLDDQGRVVAADPDRDQVYVVDLTTGALQATVALEPGDEPGRLTAASGATIFVALRRGNAVVAIDTDMGSVLGRIAVCDAPRGIGYDTERARILVACLGGQLVGIDETSFEIVWSAPLPNDLRDIVVTDEGYWVSRFKSAEVLAVDPETASVRVLRPETVPLPEGTELNDDGTIPAIPGAHEPRVLRRMFADASGHLVLHHQRANQGRMATAYYGNVGLLGGAIAHGAVTTFVPTTETFTPHGALPPEQAYDIAVSSDGERLVAVSTSFQSSTLHQTALPGRDALEQASAGQWVTATIEGQATAVAFDGLGRVLVQTREPAAIEFVGSGRVVLSDDSRFDTGHAIFHASTPVGLSCASCHPEGGEDGMTWDFSLFGRRQTAPLYVGIMSTLPLHWLGELPTILEIMADTYQTRMQAQPPSHAQAQAVGLWLDTVTPPARAGVELSEAAARGQQHFATAKCDRCHSGAQFTDNQNYDVGTGAALQTAPLVGLRYSAPYMHDGCALTLIDRFDPACGGNAHGDTSALGEAELIDLVAYLETL